MPFSKCAWTRCSSNQSGKDPSSSAAPRGFAKQNASARRALAERRWTRLSVLRWRGETGFRSPSQNRKGDLRSAVSAGSETRAERGLATSSKSLRLVGLAFVLILLLLLARHPDAAARRLDVAGMGVAPRAPARPGAMAARRTATGLRRVYFDVVSTGTDAGHTGMARFVGESFTGMSLIVTSKPGQAHGSKGYASRACCCGPSDRWRLAPLEKSPTPAPLVSASIDRSS